jgi:protein-tyrosine-phosphatase/predicted ATP-grasp superfamily ATP-dependent carboligase
MRTDSPAGSARETILVLDADGRVGLACLQSLGPRGHRVHVGVRRLASPTERSRWCHRVHAQPPAEPVDAGVAWLLELDARFGFRLVIATTEASLRWLRALPEDHPVRAKAVLPSDDALDAALDKSRTGAFARELGLPVPTTRELPRGHGTALDGGGAAVPDDGTIRYPRVLKPVRSKVVVGPRLASLSVVTVRDAAERANALATLLPFTAIQEQAWVPGRGVGVEVLYERGRMAWHFVHERLHEWPLTGGASTLRRAGGAEPALVEMTRRLLDRLQWHGVAMVEWRRDAAGNTWLVEINPRLWGSLPLTIAAGVDMPHGLLALARGEPLPAARPWKTGLVARNLTDDLQWALDNLRADHRDPLLLTEPPWRVALGWLRALTGRERWDGWSLRDLAIARGELAAIVHARFAAAAVRIRRRAALARARKRHAAMVRDGVLSRPVASVLFICLGNICRSPFAAAVAFDRLPGMAIDSAGFLQHDGRPSPPHIVTAAKSLGVDVSGARAQRVTASQIAAANLIVCMDLAHLELIEREFPEALDKTTLLGLFADDGPAEIRDPYDLSPSATRVVLQQMLRAIDAFAGVQAQLALR